MPSHRGELILATVEKQISLVIPAWNEQDYLPRLLQSVAIACAAYRGGSERIEVIVADNGSTDATAQIAHAAGCLVVSVERRCIAAARNGGAARASGRIIAFADADFRIDPETFNYIDAIMSHDEVVGGATGMTMERWSLGIRTTLWLVAPLIWMMGLDAGVWFCRRSDFELTGRFDESLRAAEDLKWLLALRRLGRKRRPRARTVTCHSARRYGLRPALAINSVRKFDKHGDWHFLRHMLLNAPRLLYARKLVDDHIENYWYQDRASKEPLTGEASVIDHPESP